MVVAVEIALYEVGDLVAGMFVWPWEQSAVVLNRYLEWAESAPNEVTASARLLQVPPLPEIPEAFRGRQLVVIDAAIVGTDDEAACVLAPLRELEPELDTFGSVGPEALLRLHMDPEPPMPGIGDGMMLGAVDADAVVAAIMDVAGPGTGSPLIIVELRQLGGALAAHRPGAGALGSLQGSFAFYALGAPMAPGVADAVEQRITQLKAALAPWDSGRIYLNFADRRIAIGEAIGKEAAQRLVAIKHAIDPDGVFKAGHRIEVGTASAARLAA